MYSGQIILICKKDAKILQIKEIYYDTFLENYLNLYKESSEFYFTRANTMREDTEFKDKADAISYGTLSAESLKSLWAMSISRLKTSRHGYNAFIVSYYGE